MCNTHHPELLAPFPKWKSKFTWGKTPRVPMYCISSASERKHEIACTSWSSCLWKLCELVSKCWRTALHRFYVYRNTYFISRDSKMCTLEVLLFCVWCLDNWSRILSGKPLNTFSMTRLKHCNFIWPSHHDLWNSQQWQISISLNRDFDLFLLTRNHLNCHYHQIDFALKQVVPISYYIKGRSPFNGRLYDFW